LKKVQGKKKDRAAVEETQRLLAKAKADALEDEAEGKLLLDNDVMGCL
jgi:hypothetical protein